MADRATTEQLQTVADLANVFVFRVPPSPRPHIGPAVTTAKRALIRAFRPFHIELLRPQQAFNLTLAEGLEQITSRRPGDLHAVEASRLQERLQSNADPTAWRVGSHRAGLAKKVVGLAKRSYLAGFGPLLTPVMEGQRRWNAAVSDAIAAVAAHRFLSKDRTAEILCTLQSLSDPFPPGGLGRTTALIGPLWREVLRRQVAFNRETARLLVTLLPTWSAPTGLAKACVVAAVFNKRREVPFFLESLRRQWFSGTFTAIVVDDCSTDGTYEVLTAFAAQNPWLKALRTEVNSGQCVARNLGLRHARGDFFVIIDGDMVLNPDFLSAHATEYLRHDRTDVVVGPHNNESGSADPWEMLSLYERNPAAGLDDSRLQDPFNRVSFLNCITRNFSIRRDLYHRVANGGGLFDERFSYRSHTESGYGWEDVDLGIRLYRAGARIAFARGAVPVHMSHPPSMPERLQPLGSVKNFKKLLAKHPDLPRIAPGWSDGTFSKIGAWLDRCGHRSVAERVDCQRILDGAGQRPRLRRSERRLRILTYRWHCGHQYELYKLPHDFTLARGLTTMTQEWDFSSRPLRSNARMIPLEDVRMDSFDAAILHFDENSLNASNSNGVLPEDWGALFQHLRDTLRIPMVAVCHGTPQFRGQYDFRHEHLDAEPQVIEEERRRLVEFMGDTLVVCNSHQAAAEWGFRRSRVIWHGFDPAEYPPALRKKTAITVAGSLSHRPHYRGYRLYQEVTRGLPCDNLSGDLSDTLAVQEPENPDGDMNDYAYHRFRNYVDFVRDYSVFFNPTLRSPMPRSRGEAMMCGLAILTADNHDTDRFIENGVNGFRSPDAGELREHLKYLLGNPDAAKKIGEAGRATAMKLFHSERYLQDWEDTLAQLIA